jgi:hypothetical protein
MGQRRLARSAAAKNHDASHLAMMSPGGRFMTGTRFVGKPLISPNVGRCTAGPDRAECASTIRRGSSDTRHTLAFQTPETDNRNTMDHVLITRRLSQLSSVAAWPFTSLADRLFARRGRHRLTGSDESATPTPGETTEVAGTAAATPWATAVAEQAAAPAAPVWVPAEPALAAAEEPLTPEVPECEPTVPTVPVTFTLPAEVGAADVALCGDFNNWDTGPIPLIRDTDGPWQVTVPLAPGNSYRYRYLLDGERWENSWDADRYEPNPYGSDNSVVKVDWPGLALQSA